MHYYQFNIADWALHTNHLSLEEDAVYRRMLDYYYDTELPIPKETQSVIRRLRLANHSDIFALILSEFFKLKDDGWHNLRADKEILEYKKKGETARANGRKGGRPKKNTTEKTQSVILANPEGTQKKANQELRTNNQELIKKTKAKKDKPKNAQEVEQYALTIDYHIEGQSFIDHYEANGWMRGKSKVKCWRACVRTWKKNNSNQPTPKSQQPDYEVLT